MTTTTFVSTASEISVPLSCIKGLPRSPPSLYVDFEGAKLSRTGTISLLTLYVLPIDTVYLTDIDSLGAAGFYTPAPTTSATATFPDPVSATAAGKQTCPTEPVLTLKSVLESPTIPKVFFDLMKLGTRSRKPRHHLVGLAWCIEHNNGMSSEARRHAGSVKKQGIQLFCPGKGGSYAVFDERPLHATYNAKYCVMKSMTMLPSDQAFPRPRAMPSPWIFFSRSLTLPRRPAMADTLSLRALSMLLRILLELLLRCARLASSGSWGCSPLAFANSFRTSVKLMTPLSLPDRLAPLMADAEMADATAPVLARCVGDVELTDVGPMCVARRGVMGDSAGVGGPEDGLSTTHMRCERVATSFATREVNNQAA
ncbi:hypothetical protein HBI81_243940 [Parastagonospora nodorum]|nr:hypothetical protein HBI81_243940 [Parastagonospora nodorum]